MLKCRRHKKSPAEVSLQVPIRLFAQKSPSIFFFKKKNHRRKLPRKFLYDCLLHCRRRFRKKIAGRSFLVSSCTTGCSKVAGNNKKIAVDHVTLPTAVAVFNQTYQKKKRTKLISARARDIVIRGSKFQKEKAGPHPQTSTDVIRKFVGNLPDPV